LILPHIIATQTSMRIIRDYQFVEPIDRGASAAIGNFDGVHLGHQSVIDLARSAAPDAPLGVMTFAPHPREYFAPDAPPFRLMSREARSSRLAKLGVERLYELNFNAALAGLTPEEFARLVVSDGLGLAHVIVGADFCFGKGRAGNALGDNPRYSWPRPRAQTECLCQGTLKPC